MTNGEKLQSIFPNMEWEVKDNTVLTDVDNGSWFSWDWWNAEYKEPTTKNDLVVDAVSRKKLLKIYEDRFYELQKLKHLKDNKGAEDRQMGVNYCINILKEFPSVTSQEPRWIPVSEKLPNDRDWYLGIFKEPDTGWINPLPFICDYVGHETKETTKEYWILRGFTDWDDYHIDYYFNLECVAWMPLPKAYREVEG